MESHAAWGNNVTGGWFRIRLPDILKAGYDPGMTLLLPVLALAFAASGVWLTARIFNRRKCWVTWTAVGLLVALPFLYVVSVGPVCWSADQYHRYKDTELLRRVYRPLRNSLAWMPEPVVGAVWWWAGFGCHFTGWDF